MYSTTREKVDAVTVLDSRARVTNRMVIPNGISGGNQDSVTEINGPPSKV